MRYVTLFVITFTVACSGSETSSKEDTTPPRDAGRDVTTPPIDARQLDTHLADTRPQIDASEVGCGDVGFIGRCDGDQLLWCLSEEIFVYDCTNPALDFAGPDRTCGLQDCTDEAGDCKGYFCVVKEGKSCDPLDPVEPALCDASKHGCLFGVCAPSEACDEETYTNSCEGDVLSYCRYRVQNVDCSLGGEKPYTCGENSRGQLVCLGLEGGGCDLAKGYECAEGLTCVNKVCS